MTEMTHTLQHLMNQASADTNFLANLRGVLEHHATKIDTVQREQFDYEEEMNTLTGQMREVLAMIECNDSVVKQVIEDIHSKADGSLRGDVQSEVEKMNARMNEIIKTLMSGIKAIKEMDKDKTNDEGNSNSIRGIDLKNMPKPEKYNGDIKAYSLITAEAEKIGEQIRALQNLKSI